MLFIPLRRLGMHLRPNFGGAALDYVNLLNSPLGRLQQVLWLTFPSCT